MTAKSNTKRFKKFCGRKSCAVPLMLFYNHHLMCNATLLLKVQETVIIVAEGGIHDIS